MPYQIFDDAEQRIDAHLDISGRELVFYSRGGATGQAAARNSAYGEGLRLVLERLAKAGIEIEGAWVDSGRVQHLPLEARSIFEPSDSRGAPADQFRVLSARMKAFGRTATGPGGNSTKRIRLRLGEDILQSNPQDLLGVAATRADFRSQERLPAEVLNKITAEHIWSAVQRMLSGDRASGFGLSTDFDLIVDGDVRLPPKAVYGLAATEALGFEVLPRHFSGGTGTPCFRALEAAGFEIVEKGAQTETGQAPPPNEDRVWAEGNPRLVQHLRRERAPGLSRAKKQAFIREHGRLFCERCKLDPIAAYGSPVAEACIEAHHATVAVHEMGKGHRTLLKDLQCLCANCHRYVHAALKRELALQTGAGVEDQS